MVSGSDHVLGVGASARCCNAAMRALLHGVAWLDMFVCLFVCCWGMHACMHLLLGNACMHAFVVGECMHACMHAGVSWLHCNDKRVKVVDDRELEKVNGACGCRCTHPWA